MKTEIKKVLYRFLQDGISSDDAAQQILDIFGWVKVYDKTPPDDVELLAKAPDGTIHLTNWRPAYDIFCCQSKEEDAYDWEWKLV
jgi:hypothetical protein